MNASGNNVFDLVRRLVARRASVPLLAPLLVVALLLCHGAAGGLHQAALEPAPAAAAHPVPSEGHSAKHSVEHSPSHADYVAYFAAFFAAMFGALMRPSFGIIGRRSAAPLATLRAAFATPLLCRGLAPTAPNLQVFRL